MTRTEIEKDIRRLEELIDYCNDLDLQGVIVEVNGKTELWYLIDMKNWLEEDQYKLWNEVED